MKQTKQLPKIFLFLATGFLLGSCQLGKHYTRPQLQLPETLDSTSVDSTSLGDYPWEQLYTDTTLQALIRKALTYNKDMLIAASRVKELAAMKRIDYAKTLLLDPDLPVIDVALQCGFSSLSAFLRMFKQLNKCTPTEFRNMYDY